MFNNIEGKTQRNELQKSFRVSVTMKRKKRLISQQEKRIKEKINKMIMTTDDGVNDDEGK